MTSVKTERKDIANRYTENTVHLSLTDSTIYAANYFVLKAKKVNVKNALGETKDILIPFDVLNNIGSGNCKFTVTEGEGMYKVVVKNTATDKVVSYSFEKQEKFLNYKERGETKQAGKDNSIQPKEEKPIVQYTDDMLELISLDLDSMTYTVNGDIGTEKDIASIVLYDKIGKIVVFFEDGEKRECLFDGESILQSVLKDN